MKKSFISGLIVLLVLIVAITGLSALTIFGTSSSNKRQNVSTHNYNPTVAKKYKNQYIAALYVDGVIAEATPTYNQEWILTTIQELKYDSKNIGIAVYVDSPGGSAYDADEVYLALQDYKSTGKNVWVYQGPMAASGGYYISCAGNEIWANRNTLTGSIGVISSESFDVTELLEKIGIKTETIHAGKNKNMGNFNEPLSDEQREILQGVADECYEQFCSIVSNQRKIPLNELYEIADGRIYTASQAKDLKLIDNIGSFDEMLEVFAEELDRPGIKVKEIKYNYAPDFTEWLFNFATMAKASGTNQNSLFPKTVTDKINSDIKYPAYIYR